MQIVNEIPDAIGPRVLTAFDAEFPGREQLDPIPTKLQWFKRQVGSFIKDVTRAYEAKRDAEIARAAAVIKADNEIVVT